MRRFLRNVKKKRKERKREAGALGREAFGGHTRNGDKIGVTSSTSPGGGQGST